MQVVLQLEETVIKVDLTVIHQEEIVGQQEETVILAVETVELELVETVLNMVGAESHLQQATGAVIDIILITHAQAGTHTTLALA